MHAFEHLVDPVEVPNRVSNVRDDASENEHHETQPAHTKGSKILPHSFFVNSTV